MHYVHPSSKCLPAEMGWGTGQSRRVYGTGPGGSCPFWERCWEWHKLETIVHGDNNATIRLDILGSLYFDAKLCDHFWNGPGWKPLYIAIRRQRLPGDNIATLRYDEFYFNATAPAVSEFCLRLLQLVQPVYGSGACFIGAFIAGREIVCP